MKRMMLFILLTVFLSFGQDLDSLIVKGQKATNRARHLKSFMLNKTNKDTIAVKTDKGFIMVKRHIAYEPDAVQRINDLEASVDKLTTICTNLQKQSDSHSDNQELFLKWIEIISGLVSIVGVILGLYFSKKK
jgi:hypothetical protein